ncbi:M56 family metallopeptidase [Streptomyces sp. NPDC002082]|uniref:M56 family metallopeptidase n=1 Tax=Streptomyces sp. NPDC002082 TaxID=3154772 RepID=UPI00332976ED
MNHHVLPPLITAVCTGLLCPGPLARARWAGQAPRLAVAAWGLLAAAFTAAVALGAMLLFVPYEDAHRLGDHAAACLAWSGQDCAAAADTVDGRALGAAAVVLALPAAAFCRELLKARRRRGRHAHGLRLIGRADTGLRATVVPHAEPAVYCLPGRAAQIVVTTGALDILSEAQLAAALRHERAHIAGRHHVVIGAVTGFGRVFRGLPLARQAAAQVPLLLEMAADDRALRHCARDVLATALYSMASARVTDRSAFAAGGPSVALRIARILDRPGVVRPVLTGLVWMGTRACVIVPVATTCCLILG